MKAPAEMTGRELAEAIGEARRRVAARYEGEGPRATIPEVYTRTMLALEEERARRMKARAE